MPHRFHPAALFSPPEGTLDHLQPIDALRSRNNIGYPQDIRPVRLTYFKRWVEA